MPRSSSRSRRLSDASLRPLVGFLLLACFGILFAGCGGGEPVDEFVISEDEMTRFREMASDAEKAFLSGTVIDVGDASSSAGSGAIAQTPPSAPVGSGSRAPAAGVPVVDLSQVPVFNALRASPKAAQGNVYMVTNTFVNLRSKPAQNAENLERLVQGDMVEVQEFTDAAWAKVKAVSTGKEGYLSTRFVAKLTTDDKLESEKKAFEGMYFVNYAFVNVRAQPNQASEKLGQIPGQSIVKPLSRDAQWSKVMFQGKEGYAASNYLSPFLPAFIVRQDSYRLPILHYKLGQAGMIEAMEQHLGRLRRDGIAFQTMRSFQDLLIRQQADTNVRLPENAVIIAVTGITPENVRQLSDALGRAGARATLFIESEQLGITGLTEKQILTLVANGHDIQSATHTGDDLRALTNAQVELELKQSRKMLEEFTRRTVTAVAYPQGGVNDRVAQIAADSGYLFGVSSSAEKTFSREQLLKLPSLQIFPTMTADEVVTMAKGS
jgi:peptidoglycan/xylan/chitin deacetylase (PgdA/CDA1 family)